MGDQETYKKLMQGDDECPAGLGEVKVIDLTPHKAEVPNPIEKTLKDTPKMFFIPEQTEHGTEWHVLGEVKNITSGQLTYLDEPKDEKDGSAWVLEDMGKVDVCMEWKHDGRLPRKMKKALTSDYRRDTKWKRKLSAWQRRNRITLHDAEVVVTRQQQDTLSAVIRASPNCPSPTHASPLY